MLAGRECRKHYGLRLLREGWAPTLLLSVGRFEIRRFANLELPSPSLDLLAIASPTPPEGRHYFVEIRSGVIQANRIERGRLGTMSEMSALAAWLQAHPAVRSVMVVSSGFHLRRVRMCCGERLPEGPRWTFVAVPEETEYLRERWWRDLAARKLLFSEVLKIAIYRLLGNRLMGRGPATGPPLFNKPKAEGT